MPISDIMAEWIEHRQLESHLKATKILFQHDYILAEVHFGFPSRTRQGYTEKFRRGMHF